MNHATQPSPRTLRSARAIIALAAITAAPLLVSCGGNPLSSVEDDYARIAPERLRQITARNFDEQKKPADAVSTAPTPDQAKARLEHAEKVTLSIEDCRAAALTNNLDLKIAMMDPTIAKENISREEARFESLFTLRGAWSETDSPTASDLDSSAARSKNIEPGVRIPLRTGETVQVSLPVSRLETNNSFSTLNPSYTSDLVFSLSQPLLRGAGRRANTSSIKIASLNAQASEASTKLEAIRQLAAVDRAYWRLFRVRRELEVAQQQYELAVAQLQRAERRVNAGGASEIEVIRAQAGVADRLEAIIVAANSALTQQRELKRIINRPDLPVDADTQLITATPPDPAEFVFDAHTLIQTALHDRMEMLDLELRLAADALAIDLNRSDALPLVTMDYSYRVNGLGGSLNRSFQVMRDNRFEDWTVGLTAQVPIGNEEARSRIRQSILQRLQRLSTKEAREQSIRREVLDAIDTINSGWQRVLASRQSVILNTRAFQAEQRQFDVGNSTSTNVLDAAARLAESQVAEARALTDYQVAQIDLAFATGTLLGAGKVDWTPAPTPSQGLDARLPEWLDWIKRVPGPGDPEPAAAPSPDAPPATETPGTTPAPETSAEPAAAPAESAQPAPPSNQ
ncbi:MAG: TolC family protein [Phycisphaerales bacterium]|nr:TolC family protein [Phycisphaerales bacterium]